MLAVAIAVPSDVKVAVSHRCGLQHVLKMRTESCNYSRLGRFGKGSELNVPN